MKMKFKKKEREIKIERDIKDLLEFLKPDDYSVTCFDVDVDG